MGRTRRELIAHKRKRGKRAPLTMMVPAASCLTPSKFGFADRLAAELHLEKMRKRAADRAREKTPVRAYRCRCGRWHITSMLRGSKPSERRSA